MLDALGLQGSGPDLSGPAGSSRRSRGRSQAGKGVGVEALQNLKAEEDHALKAFSFHTRLAQIKEPKVPAAYELFAGRSDSVRKILLDPTR